MVLKAVDDAFQSGDGGGMERERSVGAKLRLDLVGAGGATGPAEHILDAATLLAPTAERDGELGLEALRKLMRLQG